MISVVIATSGITARAAETNSLNEVGEWGWQMEGLTENYLRVNAFAPSPRWNEIDRVTIREWDGQRIKGIISNTG